VRLKSTETDVRGDDGVNGVSSDRFRKGKGLLRTRNGDNGFLKMIWEDDSRNLFFCSFFFCTKSSWCGAAWIGGKLKTFSLESSGKLLSLESEEEICPFLELLNGAAKW
jgi:hypothetical protein